MGELAGAVEPLIIEVRGHRVVLDVDLARLYGVATKRFNEAFKRNRRRFPDEFAFQMTAGEFASLRSQAVDSAKDNGNRPQIATGSQKHRNPRARPWVFTEHGALMAANILRSERAIQMSVFVIRAFVRLLCFSTTPPFEIYTASWCRFCNRHPIRLSGALDFTLSQARDNGGRCPAG